MTALQRWSSFDQRRPVRPWLFGIAFRVSADHRGRSRHTLEVLVEPDENRAVASDDPEAAVSTRQRSVLLDRALLKLDEAKRATFLLHFGEGLSPAEIAEALELPLATVYTRLRTARLELTETVKQLSGGRHE